MIVNPGEVHWAEGDETWLECYSEPGWTSGDHVLVKEKTKRENVKIVVFVPKLHRNQVLKIFNSRPDIFPEREIAIVFKETREPSVEGHLKRVAVYKKRAIGYISALRACDSEDSWLLGWLAISEDYQRQGVGSLLMGKILEDLSGLKVSKLFVETCSCEGEKPAREFYKKQGCQQIAILPNYYAKGHSKVIFLKLINQSSLPPENRQASLTQV